jgi:hypothetical protein
MQRIGARMNRNTLRPQGARFTPMSTYYGTGTGARALAVGQASVVVAEFFLSRHESFRAEIIQRRGKAIVAISRWKQTSGLPRRTGAAIEFAAHRTAGIIKLLNDLLCILESDVGSNGADSMTTCCTAGSASRRLP